MHRKTLILLGAGHAHLLLIGHLDELRAAGIDPLLIAPRWFHYSGLATGVLSGDLAEDVNRIDVRELAQGLSLIFVEGRALRVEDRTVILEDGRGFDFDLLSTNTGSKIAGCIGGEGSICPVKPLSGLAALRSAMENHHAAGQIPAMIVAGAGPSGTEIAACLAGLAERRGASVDILLAGPRRDARGWPGLYAALQQRGIRLTDRKVIERTAGTVRLDDGSTLPCEYLVQASGLVAQACGRVVEASLRSSDNPAIFAVGDCADFGPRSLPKLGVFGVREAPMLMRNLLSAARGEPLVDYRPQKRWLSIMDLGNGQGFATWGKLTNRSRLALRIKRHLDFAFLSRIQHLRETR